MAEISRKHYSHGRRDGERGAIPIDPWAPPASEWNTEERRAYIGGWRVGRATTRPPTREAKRKRATIKPERARQPAGHTQERPYPRIVRGQGTTVPMYEVVLSYDGQEDVRVTDQALTVGQTLTIDNRRAARC